MPERLHAKGRSRRAEVRPVRRVPETVVNSPALTLIAVILTLAAIHYAK